MCDETLTCNASRDGKTWHQGICKNGRWQVQCSITLTGQQFLRVLVELSGMSYSVGILLFGVTLTRRFCKRPRNVGHVTRYLRSV